MPRPKREHPDTEFVASLLDRFGAFAPVSARAMFGGFGLYVDGAMFALVDDGTAYLRADDVNRPAFEALGIEAWRYEAAGKSTRMPYYPPPEEHLDAPDLLREWFEGARAAARRAATARKPRKPKGA
ncbi:MAG: TfoX/Sxy family protein [Chloroflexi bacterium]|nr:TfoX/Sxy family protein [Chloroflexota bacterium]MDA1240743.1 TfoX/Sxy family protein [Chloroflexota bacterium]MQC47912.1 TfoX family protein [Chloroflexota bacterium]